MTATAAARRVGSIAWSTETSGQLSAAETRALLPAVAAAHVRNIAGRLGMVLRLSSGGRAHVPPLALRAPSSTLTREAEQVATERLSPALLNHAWRCYLFGAALAELERVDVDHELLFAAAMLHDTGLRRAVPGADFTVASARIALDVAETVGLSTAATETMRTAITLHHSPDVTLADGPVAYLMSSGAAADVLGLRTWQLPPAVVASVVEQHPRLDFKKEFRSLWAAEARANPRGRARLLRRYGAFDLGIRLAPYRG